MIILDFSCYIIIYIFIFYHTVVITLIVSMYIFQFLTKIILFSIYLFIHNTIIVLITSDVSRSPLSLVLDLSGVSASFNILKSS